MYIVKKNVQTLRPLKRLQDILLWSKDLVTGLYCFLFFFCSLNVISIHIFVIFNQLNVKTAKFGQLLIYSPLLTYLKRFILT